MLSFLYITRDETIATQRIDQTNDSRVIDSFRKRGIENALKFACQSYRKRIYYAETICPR